MTAHSTHWHGRGPDAVSVPGTVEDCAECGQARVITLCGSTRFKSEFESWNNRNGTHTALERTGRLSHPFEPADVPEGHPARSAS